MYYFENLKSINPIPTVFQCGKQQFCASEHHHHHERLFHPYVNFTPHFLDAFDVAFVVHCFKTN